VLNVQTALGGITVVTMPLLLAYMRAELTSYWDGERFVSPKLFAPVLFQPGLQTFAIRLHVDDVGVFMRYLVRNVNGDFHCITPITRKPSFDAAFAKHTSNVTNSTDETSSAHNAQAAES
jgi:hypothetical protein